MSKELLFSVTKKDFILHWFSGTGAGGQSRNKNQMCLRLSHPDSGASATGQSSKSRETNKVEAFRNLIETTEFKMWINRKIFESLENETIEEKVQKQMNPKNLKVEGKEDDKWTEIEKLSGDCQICHGIT